MWRIDGEAGDDSSQVVELAVTTRISDLSGLGSKEDPQHKMVARVDRES